MSRMFNLWKDGRIETVNPFNGCRFGCYGGNCRAARMAKRLQGAGIEGYENGFEPSWCPQRMDVPDADIVWIGGMGDIAFQSTKNITRVIEEMIEPNPETLFFLETKDPSTYERFIGDPPENVIVSTTIKSNRPHDVTDAPAPLERFLDFKDLDWPRKHVSVEPVKEFDFRVMLDWMSGIDPEVVSVGYDNYGCDLPEPPEGLVKRFMGELEGFAEVEAKTESLNDFWEVGEND